MELADILSEDCVVVTAEASNNNEVLAMLAERAASATGFNADQILASLSDREALGSTGLGNGIAVPHGKFAPLKRVIAVFLKLKTPVDFEAVDDHPVDVVMMLLAPVGAGADHLKALARVARILRTDSVVEALRRSNDPAKLYSILTGSLEATKAA
jgi:PTS system nitrogen regulatory IIA component